MVARRKVTHTCSKSYAGFIPSQSGYMQVFQTENEDDAMQWASEWFVTEPRVFVQEVITITNYFKFKLI